MYITILKPFIDFIGALFLLLIFSPVMIVVALLIYFNMSRPIVFIQNRPGKHGEIFNIFKFRTMSNDKDSEGNLLSDEERLKGFGQFIRASSLDELPQLFNVLRGEMSFIGPRPLLVEYLPLYNEEQKKRHNVKPGISGWAQINGRNAISWKRKFELDSYYADNISLLFDMKIIVMTVSKVFKREGISSSSHVSMEKFNGNN